MSPLVRQPRPAAASLSSLRGARGLLAAFVESYREAKLAAAKAERSQHELAKAAAIIKRDMCI